MTTAEIRLDEAVFDNVEVNAALNDLKVPSKGEYSFQDTDGSIGQKLMDRKRLRIFATITKKKTENMSSNKQVNSLCSGSFL